MKKNNNHSLAFDILREEKRRTLLWRTAFIVAFAVVIIDCIVGKGRTDREPKKRYKAPFRQSKR